MSLEGSQLGRYQLSHMLGSGSMGEVYLAEDSGICRQVAIKVVRSEPFHYLDEENARLAKQLFEQEMRVIAQLDHSHILPLYDYGDSSVNRSTVTYMVMPYRPEGSLLAWLHQQHNHGRQLSLLEIVSLIEQAASAIAHAHEQQVIHQDVKPSNFLIRVRPEAPDHPDLLLTDFGISHFVTMLTQSNQFVQGTPIYMAPEHWKGHPTYASDQYSLAVMTYELMVGHPPFEGRHEQIMYGHLREMPAAPSCLNKALPPAVDAVLLRALEKLPEKRFASVTAFAEALLQACAHGSNTFATVSVNDNRWPSAVNRQPELAQEARFANNQGGPANGSPSVSSSGPVPMPPPPASHRLATARQRETGQPVSQFTETPNNLSAAVKQHAPGINSSLATRLSSPAVVKWLKVVLAIVLIVTAGELFYYFGFLKAEARPAPVASYSASMTPTVTGNATTLPAQIPRGDEATVQDQATANAQATSDTDAKGTDQANNQATTRVTAQKLPLYLLSSPSLAGNFYTASATERDKAVSNGYQYKGIAGYVFSTQVAGSTPLYLLFNPKLGDRFYTTSATDRANVIAGGHYQDEGIVGYVFNTQVADSTPLYQLFILKAGYHFYTESASERDTATARDGYEDGGIVCYILTA